MTDKKAKPAVPDALPDTQPDMTPPPEPVVRPVTIAANPLRKQLVLTANHSNKNSVWLGGKENEGTPLLPGEKITLDTDQALAVIGEAGDWCYVAELVTVPPLSRSAEDN